MHMHEWCILLPIESSPETETKPVDQYTIRSVLLELKHQGSVDILKIC